MPITNGEVQLPEESLLCEELFTTVALEQKHELAGKSCFFACLLQLPIRDWVNFCQKLDNAGT